MLPRFSHGWPSHSHPHSQRVESLSLTFLRSALHNAHDLIHILLLHSAHTMFDSDVVIRMRPGCHLIVKRLPPLVAHAAIATCFFVPLWPPHARFSLVHTSLCQLKPNRFADSYQGMLFRAASFVSVAAGMHTARGRTVVVSLAS